MTVPSAPPGGAIIQRVESPAERYAIVSNSFARDHRLGFFARGVGVFLLSHRDGWEITASGIARQAGIGRDQVRRALVELEHHRYLRRVRQRSENGKLGPMLYLIRCTPFPCEDEDNPRSDLRLVDQAQADQAPVSAHHKKTSPKDTTSQKENPSRGAAAPAPAARSPEEDEPMPARKPPADQPLPFDLPGPVKAEPAPSARDVVAAYVSSYAENHSGGRPVPADIGRVSRDAKAALSAGKASVPELVAAATALGATPYANLGVQLGITRSSKPVARIAPVAPRGSFDEAHHQSKLRFAEKIRTDRETAAWVAQDPVEVQNMIDFDPTLLEAFRAVGAA